MFSFGQLNLASLNLEKRAKVVEKYRLVSTKAVKIFEYKKNNNGYWDEAKLYYQMMKKALPITKALYFRYSLFFVFNNVTSNSVYTKYAL